MVLSARRIGMGNRNSMQLAHFCVIVKIFIYRVQKKVRKEVNFMWRHTAEEFTMDLHLVNFRGMFADAHFYPYRISQHLRSSLLKNFFHHLLA